jgi:hypothetical protein
MQPVGLTCPWLVALALLAACSTERAPLQATELNAPPALHHTVPTPDAGADPPPADADAVDADRDAAPTPGPDVGPDAAPTPGPDVGPDAAPTPGPDVGPDAAPTPGPDVGPDAAVDAGPDPDPDMGQPNDATTGEAGGPAPDMQVARDAAVDAEAPPAPDMGAPPAPDAGPVNGDAGRPGRLIFTGPSPDERTVAGLVIVDGQISFYVCGSAETLAMHTWWLFGAVGADGRVDLIDDDEFWLTGRVEDDRFRGTYGIPMSDDTLELDLPLAAPDARSEMYEVLDSGCLTGVVVIENGEETPRIQGATGTGWSGRLRRCCLSPPTSTDWR